MWKVGVGTGEENEEKNAKSDYNTQREKSEVDNVQNASLGRKVTLRRVIEPLQEYCMVGFAYRQVGKL